MTTSPSLLLDLYELTMAAAYRREGLADAPATFSLFVRTMPPERGYLVAAGLDDCLEWLESLAFGAADIDAIARLGLFDDDVLDWLRQVRFTGDVRAVPEGTIVFGGEPILEVDAPIAVAQLAETYLLNQVTLQTVLATKASRYRHAARGRALVDFALRRCQGVDAGMKLARVCRLVGFAGTSNVAAAERYGLPASGTMAHSFVQAHSDETDAFRAFGALFGPRAILLVDTYDTHRGVERAITAAHELRDQGIAIQGIRLDSGDLLELARFARERLDAAGLGDLTVVASGGLDEHSIDALVRAGAPVDGFGVGTTLGVSADAPSLDTVYKLVQVEGRPVRKTSPGKQTWPSPKQVWRADDWSHDVLTAADEPVLPGANPLLVEVMREGRRTPAGRTTLEDAADYFDRCWKTLPDGYKHLQEPSAHPVHISPGLHDVANRLGGLS